MLPRMVVSIAVNRRSMDLIVSGECSRPCLLHQTWIALSSGAVTCLDRSRPVRAISGMRSSQRSTSLRERNGPSSF